MANESSNPIEALKSYIFWQNNPNINQELRQRIALTMMGNKRAAPKNIGEGLSAIGDAIGDRGLASQLENAAAAEAAYGSNAENKYLPGATGSATPPASYAPSGGSAAPAVAELSKTVEAPEPGPAPELTSIPPKNQSAMIAPELPKGMYQGGLTSAMMRPTPFYGQKPPPPPAPEGGGYNMLDAQADVGRPGAAPAGNARGQAAGARAYPDNPDMQAYMSVMGAREQPRPGDTSSTGARGLYQFIPSTAKQYGLTNPDDDVASADAMKAFTENNIKTFTAANGRPPTMADMALMHQQGGKTGANMVAGTGNASPNNLAVNNIPPNASPQQAAAQIKGFYGLPERAPGDPRAGVSQALADQQQPPMALAGQPAPAAGLPPEITTGQSQQIAQAPAPPPVRQMPVRPAAAPAAAAQGGPGVQGYVPADPGPDPEAPPRVGLTPVQQSIMRDIAAAPPGYRKGVAEKLDPFFKREEEARQRQQSQLDAEHTRKITENAKIREDRRKYQADQYERYYKGDEQKQKADAGQHVTVEGRLMIPDHSKPPGAPWVDVTAPLPGQIPKEGEVDPPPPLRKPLTAEQQKQVKFWSEMQLAEKQLQGKEELLANSPVDAAKGGIPVFGNALQSRNYKKAVGAAEFSVLADLRPDSGAAIGIIEDAKRYKQLMPVYGDSPGIIADKRRRRQAIMDANYATLGQDLQPSAKWIMDQTVKRQAADQKKINDEMAPKFAGKKLENGYVATKGKMKRIWDATGGNWVED